MLCNYSTLWRNDGRWLIQWAAWDVQLDEYLGTFTTDEIREKAATDPAWVSIIQYQRTGTCLDRTGRVRAFNGLAGKDTILDFHGFVVSPVRIEDGQAEVCRPGEHTVWSIYGWYQDEENDRSGWLLVHDDEGGDLGRKLAEIIDLTGARVEYRDPDHACANTTLEALSELLAARILDEVLDGAASDRTGDHPLSELRKHVREAIEIRAEGN